MHKPQRVRDMYVVRRALLSALLKKVYRAGSVPLVNNTATTSAAVAAYVYMYIYTLQDVYQIKIGSLRTIDLSGMPTCLPVVSAYLG